MQAFRINCISGRWSQKLLALSVKHPSFFFLIELGSVTTLFFYSATRKTLSLTFFFLITLAFIALLNHHFAHALLQSVKLLFLWRLWIVPAINLSSDFTLLMSLTIWVSFHLIASPSKYHILCIHLFSQKHFKNKLSYLFLPVSFYT